MFSYIRFSCVSCEKPLEYTVPSDFGDSMDLDQVSPLLGMMVDGGMVVCKCGEQHLFKYDRENKILKVA